MRARVPLLAGLLVLTKESLLMTNGLIARRLHLHPTIQKSTKHQRLFARRYRYMEDAEEPEQSPKMERLTIVNADRPTETLPSRPPPQTLPSKAKIVVLGASGKIGRLVVRQLLESSIDATIVAYCRDYDKACRVLYDDIIAIKAANNKKGPTLQIVQGELVTEDMFSGESFQSNGSMAPNATSALEDEDSDDYPLEQAILGATTVISCVGSVRPTNLWKDILQRPLLRLLRKDVSSWCTDERHPYYIHYCSTRKALLLAEREQMRRVTLANLTCMDTVGQEETNDSRQKNRPLRFIRISDLCVAQKPWQLVPLITNSCQSMVFRYQEMTEQLLEDSQFIETIILRPGDLVDDERDATATAVQVGINGWVPGPSRINREDVAALAVSAALFDESSTKKRGDLINKKVGGVGSMQNPDVRPFHYTLACRWVGEELQPFPPQGKKSDGHVNAQYGMNAVLKSLTKRHHALQRKTVNNTLSEDGHGLSKHRRLKPFGVFATVATYTLLYMTTRALVRSFITPLFTHLPWIKPLLGLPALISSTSRRFVIGLWNRINIWWIWNVLRRSSRQYINF